MTDDSYTIERAQHTQNVLLEVLREREQQHLKFGEQNHRDFPDENMFTKEEASEIRQLCDADHAEGNGSWAMIFMEEVAETMAENNSVKLRAELIQVAAVAVQWIEAIDRRLAKSFTVDDVAAVMGQFAQQMLDDPSIIEKRLSIDPKKLR